MKKLGRICFWFVVGAVIGLLVQYPLYSLVTFLSISHLAGAWRDALFYIINIALFAHIYKRNPYLALGFFVISAPLSIYTAKTFLPLMHDLGGPG